MFTKQNAAILLALTGVYASPVVRRDECSDACSKEYNTCRTKPGANMSTCAAQYASCLGYLPWNEEGTLVTPTACSHTAAPTPTGDQCLAKCNAALRTCQYAPDANQSFCISEFSKCVGYLPFENGTFVTPTACAPTATVTTSPTPSADSCLEKCNTEWNTCRTKPGANMSYCAAQYSGCLGYAPFNEEGTFVTPTACATASSITATLAAATPAPVSIQAVADESTEWTVKGLTRKCSEDKSGCDYNFKLATNDGQEDSSCSISRKDIQDATTESWYDVPCNTDSPYFVSWGYSTQFEVPFAVLTVVKFNPNSQAYFGVDNPNAATEFGDIGPQPVYHN